MSTSIEEFREEARAWLAAGPLERTDAGTERAWGEGSDSVVVFHDLAHEEEQALLDRMRSWQRAKHDAGYGAIDWPAELGGRGLPAAYDAVFREEELAYDTAARGPLGAQARSAGLLGAALVLALRHGDEPPTRSGGLTGSRRRQALRVRRVHASRAMRRSLGKVSLRCTSSSGTQPLATGVDT